MARRRRPNRLLDWWTDSLATATTLAVRVPQLIAGTMTRAEERRMVAEKLAAARQGWVKAAVATTRVAALKAPRTPKAAATRGFSVLDAALGPARRTVRANAKRLTKPRKRPG